MSTSTCDQLADTFTSAGAYFAYSGDFDITNPKRASALFATGASDKAGTGNTACAANASEISTKGACTADAYGTPADPTIQADFTSVQPPHWIRAVPRKVLILGAPKATGWSEYALRSVIFCCQHQERRLQLGTRRSQGSLTCARIITWAGLASAWTLDRPQPRFCYNPGLGIFAVPA